MAGVEGALPWETVRASLQALLKSADLATTSERQITNKLRAQLGAGVVDTYKHQVKSAIAAFLEELDGGADGEEDYVANEEEDDDEDEDEDSEPGVKERWGKRKAPGKPGGAPAAKAAKTAEEGGRLPVAGNPSFVLDLGSRKLAIVETFRGKKYAGLREFYEKDGQLLPGKKGLNLTPEQWAALRGQLGAITLALEEAREEFELELSELRRVRVRSFKGRTMVDIREYYEKDGEKLPGQKGVALSEEQWRALTSSADAITEALGPAPAAPQPAQKELAPAAVDDAAARAASGAATTPAPAAVPAPAGSDTAAGGAGGSSSSGSLPIELGSKRRADISVYKGATYVGIREYYEKDGQLLPGYKGISLSVEQFNALRAAAGDMTVAVGAKDGNYELALSGKRKARVSLFKGRAMVDLREYYEKDGQQLPGKKGISLTPEQWGCLVDGMPALQAALSA